MTRKITLYVLLLPLTFLLSIGLAVAKTDTVSNTEALITVLPTLNDGDTLMLSAGTFIVDASVAPEGLVVAFSDWTPYYDVTIIGAGMDETIIDFANNQGFFVYYADDLLFKDMTIKNASYDGGIYAQNANVNIENVKFENCRHIKWSGNDDGEANGGAVCYDEASTFDYIKGCVFTNNYAENSGGAIAFMNISSTSSPLHQTISRCQIYDNTAGDDASAFYAKYSQHYIHFELNAIYNNQSKAALVLNGSRNVYFDNNAIALNPEGGVYLMSGLRARSYFTGNAIVDNGLFDCAGQNVGTLMRGDHNVVSILENVDFSGYFNEDLSSASALFKIENDSLKHQLAAAEFLAGRLPAEDMFTNDLYGDTCLFPGDIGAIAFDQGTHTAIWTGDEDQDFFNVNNWRNGLMPTGDATPSTVTKVIVSNCKLTTYPIVSANTTMTSAGNLSTSDLYITPTGLFKNEGTLALDTLIAESQNGGLGELVNEGTLNCNKRLSEFYVNADEWVPIYIPEVGMSVQDLFFGATFDDDFVAKQQVEDGDSLSALSAGDVFSQEQGYWVKSSSNQKASFEVTDTYNENFTLQHTAKIDTLESGWNMIANPYDASVSTASVLSNTANDAAAAGAVYTYDGSFKVMVDGIGDEEAEIVGPHEAFYVQALDADAAVSPSTSDFSLNTSNILMQQNTLLKSSTIEREGLLTIGLATSSNTIFDRAYVRFKSDATSAFDYSFDALKLGRIEDQTNALIYTENGDDSIAFAVNTQVMPDDAVMTIPLRLDYEASALTSSQSQRLRFSITGGDSISYLLHDVNIDKSKSVEVTDGRTVSFTTGTDAEALMDRYSLEVFDGAIPKRIVSTHSVQEVTLVEKPFTRYEVRFAYDTVSYVSNQDTLQGPGDSLTQVQYMVDSIFVDSLFVEKLYIDSVYYDSTFIDTTRLWGTYEYTEYDTVATTYYTRSMTYGDTAYVRPGVYTKSYLLYENFMPVGINDLWSEASMMKIYGYGHFIHIKADIASPLTVRVYDMSGAQVSLSIMPEASGEVEMQEPGIYIVRVEQGDRIFTEKVLINK